MPLSDENFTLLNLNSLSQLANLDQILCVASLGWGKGCVRFWGRLTLAHWTQVSDRCPLGYLFGQVTGLLLAITVRTLKFANHHAII